MAEAPDENFRRQPHTSQITVEAYFTGLAFTVLAFAVQSAKFKDCPLLTHWSSQSWVSNKLLLAGLAGVAPGVSTCLITLTFTTQVYLGQQNRYEAAAARIRGQIFTGLETVELVAENRTVPADLHGLRSAHAAP
jgi:hypothetical protein